MGCGPKKSDYKPSKAEIAQTRVAGERAQFFSDNLAPLNTLELEDALSNDIANIARGRAGAESMQGLTSNISYADTQDAGTKGSALTRSYQAELGGATAGAEKIQNMRLAGAVGVAQGQQADSSKARSVLTNIGTSEVLNKAKNNELLRAARWDAGMKIAGAGMDKKFSSGDERTPSRWDDFRNALDKYKEVG